MINREILLIVDRSHLASSLTWIWKRSDTRSTCSSAEVRILYDTKRSRIKTEKKAMKRTNRHCTSVLGRKKPLCAINYTQISELSLQYLYSDLCKRACCVQLRSKTATHQPVNMSTAHVHVLCRFLIRPVMNLELVFPRHSNLLFCLV